MTMFNQDRHQLRQAYHLVWQKMQNDAHSMTALEQQIASVIQLHPEYHALLGSTEESSQEFPPELGHTNPYLHMGLHIALQEQIMTDRPVGIRRCYQELLAKTTDEHQIMHQMIDCLAETLWQAQRDQTAPDEIAYLDRLRQLSKQR